MFGVTLLNSPADWEILQHENGFAPVTISGIWSVPKAALEVGVKSVQPMIRLMSEEDNSPIIPWTNMSFTQDSNEFSGTFGITLSFPAGGLYRIETGLDTYSTNPQYHWVFRGDVRLHIGVGNLFIIAGQSNSAGYGKDSAMDAPSLQVHTFRNCGRWDLAAHPLNESTYTAEERCNREMGVSGTSPYISFGRNFYTLSSYPVGLIPVALGGSPLKRWDKSQVGDLYKNMMDQLQAMETKFAGMLWYQGCSDTSQEEASRYERVFTKFVEDVRSDLGYELPIFTFQLNRQINGTNQHCWGIVREAQRIAAINIPGVYILPTLNCPLSDGIHNSSHSNVMLGEKLAKLCGHILCGTRQFQAPMITSATLEYGRADTPSILLHFDNVQREFMLYSDQNKDNGFLIEDALGEIACVKVLLSAEYPNCIALLLSRKPKGACVVSFGWDACPSFIPPVDGVTYLPPVAFYRYFVTQTSA